MSPTSTTAGTGGRPSSRASAHTSQTQPRLVIATVTLYAHTPPAMPSGTVAYEPTVNSGPYGLVMSGQVT